MSKSVLIRYEGDERGTWCLYWSDTQELADPREFATLEDASAAARAILWPAKLQLVQ